MFMGLLIKSSLVKYFACLYHLVFYLLLFIHLKRVQTFLMNDFFHQSNSSHAYLLEVRFIQIQLLWDDQTQSLHLFNLTQIILLSYLKTSNYGITVLHKFLFLRWAMTPFKVKLASLNIWIKNNVKVTWSS